MTGMMPERLADIRERHRVGLGLERPGDVAALLAHVDHLTAENARLRAGIERDAAVAAKALREAAPRFRHDRPSASVWAEMLDLADEIEAGESDADA